MDWELAWPILGLLFGISGLLLGILATVEYFRRERRTSATGVHLGLAAFATQYALLFFTLHPQERVLLPMMLIFLIAVNLVVSMVITFRARTAVGIRISLAAILTALAYSCALGHMYYQAIKR